MSENTLRTRPPTFPISKPGRWPQPALPPLASARNTFAQIRCHYLWQPEQRDIDAHHGMPADVERSLREQRFLRSPGQHAPDPVRRRLASWSTLTKWRGLTVSSPPLRCPPRYASLSSRRRHREKAGAPRRSQEMCWHRCWPPVALTAYADIRDRAILMVAIASGGRRRSELAGDAEIHS
jgi:hypothetical protein